MKTVYMIIGTMLVLALCITPVAAVSGDDFKVLKYKEDGIFWHKYRYMAYSNDEYIEIHPGWTLLLDSMVTFKPANIPDAPVMMVDTNDPVDIYLPYYSVSVWEIKYYSNFRDMSPPYDKYLKNAGTVNVKMVFGEYLPRGLELWLSAEQLLCTKHSYYNDEGMVEKPVWNISDVD